MDTLVLLTEVSAVAAELHPGRSKAEAALDSRLEQDLGFDSLGRVQLLSRLEAAFAVALADRVAIDAETPRDLLRAIRAAPRTETRLPPEPKSDWRRIEAGAAIRLPVDARSWIDVLEWHAEHRPDAVHIRFFADAGEGETLSYGDLLAGSRRMAGGLARHGVAPGDAVALMLPTGREYFLSFFAALHLGAVPVPLYPPFRLAHLAEHLTRQSAILTNARAPLLVTMPELQQAARILVGGVETLRGVVTPGEILDEQSGTGLPRVSPTDIALLQYTSGSTGAPKGVILSHGALLANVRAIGRAIAVRPDDVTVSWLPLYHDMGLIGAWLGSLYHGLPLILMSPLDFVARPARWLRAIHRYRGSLTAAPNFAFELCLHRLTDADVSGLDLSSLRAVHNGAEAVSPETTERFIERFAACGFRREAMLPVYGLAESAVGLTFPPVDRGPLIDVVQRRALSERGEAIPAAGSEQAMRFVSCGRPLPGHEVRIVDDRDRELPERREGRIHFRGPSATSGYVHNPQATAALFHGDWLDSGDLGYLAAGELYVTGRAKDVIIKAGRNIYPEEIEGSVGDIAGIRKGNVVAFGAADPRDGTERLVVVAETRLSEPPRRKALEQAVVEAVIDLLSMPPDAVVLAPPNTLLKTSSGKLRRSACRKLYEEGRIGRMRKPPWLQLMLLRLEGAQAGLRRTRGAMQALSFAVYTWALVGLIGFAGWCVVLLLPRLEWRWRAVRFLLKALAAAARTPLRIQGLEGLPAPPVIFVANHSSYLDGFVLSAVLPHPLCFVAKEELVRQWVVALPLRRLATSFVERFDRARSITDARALSARLAPGCSPVFFPEGTFSRMPGLLPFHMGAFELAAQTGLAVVPVAIRGTRSILRSDSWFPRTGAITVTVGSPIDPATASGHDDWTRACWLRDECRASLLRHVGEPDLAEERLAH